MYDAVLDRARILSAWHSYGQRDCFCGYAVTVRCHEDNSRVKEVLAAPAAVPHSVLVVDGGGSRRCALLGDQIAQTAVENGWAGVIVYGCVRDVEVLATMDVGVVALGATPRKSTRRGEGQVGERIRLGDEEGVWVKPGDAVFVDRNGMLFLDGNDEYLENLVRRPEPTSDT